MNEPAGSPIRSSGVTGRPAVEPLLRLLMVNLGIGVVVSLLLFGGLLAFNLHGLRDLILADQAPAAALILLLFGFVITFGSAAMGTAIMMIGQRNAPPSGGRRVTTHPIVVPATGPAARR